MLRLPSPNPFPLLFSHECLCPIIEQTSLRKPAYYPGGCSALFISWLQLSIFYVRSVASGEQSEKNISRGRPQLGPHAWVTSADSSNSGWHLQTLKSPAVLVQGRGGLGAGCRVLTLVKGFLLPLRKLEGPTLLENTSMKSSCLLAEHQLFSGIVVAVWSSISSFSPHSNNAKYIFLAPLFRLGNWDWKMKHHIPKDPKARERDFWSANVWMNQCFSRFYELRSHLEIL